MPPMRTAVVSDLHLGALGGADVAREGKERDALLEAIKDADRVVLLGDVIEMRERPLADALEVARPCSTSSGARWPAAGGARAGQPRPCIRGALARAPAAGRAGPADRDGVAGGGRMTAPRAGSQAGCRTCSSASPIPGLHLRDDVYATHGHYLDLHLTIPRLESIAASAMARVTGRGKASRSASDYEAIMGPLYAFYASLAQGASPASLSRGGSLSRDVWRRAKRQRPAQRAGASCSAGSRSQARSPP